MNLFNKENKVVFNPPQCFINGVTLTRISFVFPDTASLLTSSTINTASDSTKTILHNEG